MRTFSIMGLGALSAFTIAVTQAVPAGAVLVPPGLVRVQVCDALPAGLVGVLDQLAANANLSGLLSDDLADATADLDDKTLDLVDAILDHIQVLDGGGNVAASATVVGARAAAYADSAAVWTALWKDLDAAQLRGLVLGRQQGVLEDIRDALCGAAPE